MTGAFAIHAVSPDLVSAQPTISLKPGSTASAKPVATPRVAISAVLVPGTPVRVQFIPNFAQIGNGTIPNYQGSVQQMDGDYFTMPPSVRIMKYRNKYYLIPASAKFELHSAAYGLFCGPGWGWGSGNDSKEPLADGGLDAACRAHDRGWSAGTPAETMAADRALLAAARSLRPKWDYERDYARAVALWMDCRVVRKAESQNDRYCNFQAGLVGVANYSTVVR